MSTKTSIRSESMRPRPSANSSKRPNPEYKTKSWEYIVKTLSLLAVLVTTLFFYGTGGADAYTVYVSNEKGNSLTVIDSETLQVLTTIPVG